LNRRQYLQVGVVAGAGCVAATRLGFIGRAQKSYPIDGREMRYSRDGSLKTHHAPMRLPHFEEFDSNAISLDGGQRASNCGV
jgi:hypothetical protein